MVRNVIESPSELPLSTELQAAQKGLREIDRREEDNYDVIVLWRKLGNSLFLALELKKVGEEGTRLPEIELPSPDRVPNLVNDALTHPMRYFADAGLDPNSLFPENDLPGYLEAA